MATIATLQVLLEAKASQFNKSMKSAGGALKKFTHLGQQARDFLKAFLVGHALESFGYQAAQGLKQAWENIEKVGQAAEALDVSTKALSRLDYAAKITGVDAGQLNQALGRMTQHLGFAAAQGGKSAQIFQKLGLNLKTLIAQSPTTTFVQLAHAIKHTTDSYQRAAIMQAAFGRSSQSLMPLLVGGASELKNLGVQANATGNTISSLDFHRVENTSRAFRQMTSVLDGDFKRALVTLAPFLEKILDAISLIGNAVEKTIGSLKNMVGVVAGKDSVLKKTESFIKYMSGYDLVKNVWSATKASAKQQAAQAGAARTQENQDTLNRYLAKRARLQAANAPPTISAAAKKAAAKKLADAAKAKKQAATDGRYRDRNQHWMNAANHGGDLNTGMMKILLQREKKHKVSQSVIQVLVRAIQKAEKNREEIHKKAVLAARKAAAALHLVAEKAHAAASAQIKKHAMELAAARHQRHLHQQENRIDRHNSMIRASGAGSGAWLAQVYGQSAGETSAVRSASGKMTASVSSVANAHAASSSQNLAQIRLDSDLQTVYLRNLSNHAGKVVTA